MKQTVTGRVVKATRLGTTRRGNPRYQIVLNVTPPGVRYFTAEATYLLKADSALAYSIDNREYADRNHRFTLNTRNEITTAENVTPVKEIVEEYGSMEDLYPLVEELAGPEDTLTDTEADGIRRVLEAYGEEKLARLVY